MQSEKTHTNNHPSFSFEEVRDLCHCRMLWLSTTRSHLGYIFCKASKIYEMDFISNCLKLNVVPNFFVMIHNKNGKLNAQSYYN